MYGGNTNTIAILYTGYYRTLWYIYLRHWHTVMIYVISNLTLSDCDFLNDVKTDQRRRKPCHTGYHSLHFHWQKLCYRRWIVIIAKRCIDRSRAELSSADHRTSEEALRPAWGHNRTKNRRASETKEAREYWLARDRPRRRHHLVSETTEEQEAQLSQRRVRDRAQRADQTRKSRL